MAITLLGLSSAGCRNDDGYRNDLNYDRDVVQTWTLPESGYRLVQFEGVDVDLDSLEPLRRILTTDAAADSRHVVVIPAGSGALPLMVAGGNPNSVTAVALSDAEADCCGYNVAANHCDDIIDLRRGRSESPLLTIKPPTVHLFIGDWTGRSDATLEAWTRDLAPRLQSLSRGVFNVDASQVSVVRDVAESLQLQFKQLDHPVTGESSAGPIELRPAKTASTESALMEATRTDR